jgi:hypothetical protein
MARFFFHVKDQNNLIEDEQGLDFPDPETATAQCLEAAREILEESDWRNQPLTGRAFQIVDETGRVVLELSFTALANSGTELRRRVSHRR